MARIQIPLDVLTSRINLQERFQGFRSGPLSGRFANLRPLSEFFDMKRLSKPANFSECQSRINYNLSYFSTNYIVVMAMLSIYALLTNLVLLFDIILIAAGLFIIGRLEGRDLEIGSFRATTSQLYTGLLVVTVPLGLFASPISTLLWLIAHRRGFFRGGGLGGRPRAPEFAPQWGRPSRRRRRRTDGDAASYDYWGGDPRVQELDSEGDDSDTQGVGLSSSRRGSRFVSDSLQFTGIDLGDRSSGTYRRRHFQDDTDEDDGAGDGSSSDDGDYPEAMSRLSAKEKEEALVQSALRRIEIAQEKGRADVKLNKEELAALERRRKRMEEEAEKERKKKKKKGSGSGSDRKKSKEQRIAVPLSRLDPISRKKKSSPPVRDSPSSSRRPSATDLTKVPEAQVYPPMGYFPPPSGRTRPRSGTSLSARPPSRMHDDWASSPFNYEYVQRPSSANRHVSEGMARPSSRGLHPDPLYGWDYSPPSSSGSRDGPDPFQYQTAGPRAPYAASNTGAAAASSRRHVSGPAESYLSRRPAMAGAPAAARGRHSLGGQPTGGGGSSATDSQTSEEDTTSDELGHGAQIREPPQPVHGRGREEIVVEVSPERSRETSSKKKSSSPVKRKPVQSSGGGGGGRSRRKR